MLIFFYFKIKRKIKIKNNFNFIAITDYNRIENFINKKYSEYLKSSPDNYSNIL